MFNLVFVQFNWSSTLLQLQLEKIQRSDSIKYYIRNYIRKYAFQKYVLQNTSWLTTH